MYSAAFEHPRAGRHGWWMDGGHDDEHRGRGEGRGRGRGRGRGPGGPFVRGDFGGPFGEGGPGFGRRRRSRRGDTRAALLALLAERPMHGYQMITELESRSHGAWRPSPGSVYPTLQALEDEGLVRVEAAEGKRVFELTAAGREAAEAATSTRRMPWEDAADDVGDDRFELFGLLRQVAAAAAQLGRHGRPEQIAAGSKALAATRKQLYRILAEDDDPTPAE